MADEPQYQAIHLTRIDAEIFATRVGREAGTMYLQQDAVAYSLITGAVKLRREPAGAYKKGDPVLYVPTHANGDTEHPDCLIEIEISRTMAEDKGLS